MPKHEGVSKLIVVASTNRNREVCKPCSGWASQTIPARSILFEQVLTR